MKKRLLSILLMCCMVLTLLPTAAFAEGSEEELPVCTCETACAVETMNAECSVCGAEGASAENCAKYIKPADDAAVQPEGEVSDPQPETALTALIGGNETAKEVSNESELTAAIADSTVGTVKLAGDIDISSSLTVNRTVTLDLNGHVLKYESANKGSVIVVENGGQLTIEDSNTSNLSHKFNPNGKLWVLDEASGTEIVTGGVITGGTGYPIQFGSGEYVYYAYYGGGVYIAPGGQLTMTGGNIIGCSAEFGGGICIESERDGKQGQFSMSGGNIIGCSAECGGGVYVDSESNQSPFSMSGGSIIGCVASDIGGGVRASGTFKMSGQAVIRSCTVESATQSIYGGGIYVNSSSSFEMSGEAKIEYCQAISNSSKSSNGGGVYLTNNTKFTLSGNAVIQNCKADNSVTPGETYGGGVSADCMRQITLEGNAQIFQCTAANGSGLYITGSLMYPNDYGKLYANGGSVNGDVVLGDKDKSDGPCTITGTGETVFKGKVTVTPDSTIEKGTFNGEVINNGTITGGVFIGTVSNNGTITGGVFNNTVSGSGTITGGTFNTPMTGSGTETDPYQIRTAEGLKWFRDKVNNAKTSDETKICVVLTADIDLKNEAWTPIGIGKDTRKQDLPYSGTFDGNGHTVSGLNVNYGDKNGGLFCYVKSATIKNLTVAGSVTYSSGDGIAYGGIVGCADSSTIENCTNRCNVTGNWYAGGIVGWAANTTITGCANFGNISISGSNCVGGICGYLSSYSGDETSTNFSTIRDCYNVGSISGIYAGGIAGRSYNGDNSAYPNRIANCYNMGKVTTTASGCAGEILGAFWSTKDASLDNCYYLDTAGNNAVGQSNAQVTNTKSMTAAEFADGTVLNLLKAGKRDNNADPWADECQYLAAADKTLPVFNGQGDAHDHQSNDWESNETEHWQVCTCGAVFHKAQHSGGKATCKAKAVCEFCKASYGSLDPNSHADLKHIDAKAATAAAEGNIEYWYCEACEKYFSDADAKNEITQAQTVIPKRQSSGGGSGGSSSYPITVPSKTENGTVTVSPRSAEKGDTVTITVKPDSGYQLDDLAVTDKNGKELKLTDKGNGKYIFTMPSGKVKINATFTKEAEPSPFSDVSTSAYYYEAVKWAAENGITGGVGNSLFAPNQPCTRAQIVTFLWRAAGSPAPKSMSSFTDVPADAFYAKAVAWAVENGITSGTGEGKFSPNAICTRAQSVTFLYRASGSPAVSGSAEFSDVSTTAFYADAVAWAAKKGITTGIGGGLFGSDNDCTRSQIVTFLWRCKK